MVNTYVRKEKIYKEGFGEALNSKEFMILAIVCGLTALLIIMFCMSGCYKKMKHFPCFNRANDSESRSNTNIQII